MTIQAALAGGVEAEPVRRKLIALRVKEQDALRRRFERAKSEGDFRKMRMPPIWPVLSLLFFRV